MDLMNKITPKKYLLLVDLCGIIISFILAAWIRFGSTVNGWMKGGMFGVAFTLVILLYIVIFNLYDTFSKLFKRGYVEELFVVLKINGIMAVSLTAMMYLSREGASFSRLFFLCFFFINILINYMFRQYFKLLLLDVYKKSSSSAKVMVITTADHVHKVLSRIREENEWEYQITGLTILDKSLVGQFIDGIEVKADYASMLEVVKKEVLDGAFIHMPGDDRMDLNLDEMVLEFQSMGVTVDISINTFGLKIHEKIVREMSGYHVLTFSTRIFDDSQLILKRIIDIIGGSVGCILTAILTIVIAPAIYIESPGPILFSQVRIGKNGRRFKIYKFRSMYPDAEQRKAELLSQNEMNGLMFKIKDDPRVTKVGRFLRKTSLDEFPQFLNVLRGDMSLVGTRPPTENEFLEYESRHKRRLALKAGITGLWQVSGRNDISDFEEVVRLDLEYIDNWSLLLDIKILLKTVGVVLFGKGSS